MAKKKRNRARKKTAWERYWEDAAKKKDLVLVKVVVEDLVLEIPLVEANYLNYNLSRPNGK